MFCRAAGLACVCACAAAPPLPAPLRGVAPACLAAGGSPVVSLLDADRAAVHVCFGGGRAECFGIDRATGAIAAWKAPPLPPYHAPPPPRETATEFVPCNAHGACVHVAKQPRLTADTLQYDISDDGTLAVVTIPGEPTSTPPRFELHHLGATDRVLVLDVDDGNACGGASLLGDTVLVTTDVCAGPGGHGLFFGAEGRALGELSPPERAINAYDSAAVPLGGARWAIVAPWSAVVELIDLPSLDHRAVVDISSVQAQPTDEPSFDLARASDGTLLVASPTGGVAVLDARAAALTAQWQVPACK